MGTTVIFGFASEAGRDAWLASAISAVLGACLMLVYLFIFKATGGLTLVEWFPSVFGKWWGTLFSWLFRCCLFIMPLASSATYGFFFR
ncbi:GerAB/ArcD/ProY family transporter [Fontibacillus phaseoli]|uniref:GerAB/ArcD/ProY family transporter n=1 Tax=Fontibacillus phaseoli TaxID=1416533 RepID=UPI000DF356B2